MIDRYDIAIDNRAKSPTVDPMNVLIGRRTSRAGLAAMLLAAAMLSLQGLLASLAMATTGPSSWLDHRDCPGHADVGDVKAEASNLDRHPVDEDVLHAHDVAGTGSTTRGTPSPDEAIQKPACCAPVGMAVLPQLASSGSDRGLRNARLALTDAQVPAGHTPDGPRKPPRTSDPL